MSFHWSTENRKLVELARLLNLKKGEVVSFDLPAGYTCPMANACLSYAHKYTGKIRDGKESQFRCYAASSESAFTNTRKAHWRNFELLKGLGSNQMANAILESLPKKAKVVRIHASGDFFNKTYFNAWLKVAKARPDIQFFGYTKVLEYAKASKPSNFNLVYSYGGKQDSLLSNEPTCYVVKNESEAKKLGLPVACPDSSKADDYFYIINKISFAIILHGTQPAKKRKA